MTLPCSKSIWLLPTPFTSIWILLLMFPFKQRNVLVCDRNFILFLRFGIFNFILNFIWLNPMIFFLIEMGKVRAQFYFVEFKHFSESMWRIQILPFTAALSFMLIFSFSLYTISTNHSPLNSTNSHGLLVLCYFWCLIK